MSNKQVAGACSTGSYRLVSLGVSGSIAIIFSSSTAICAAVALNSRSSPRRWLK